MGQAVAGGKTVSTPSSQSSLTPHLLPAADASVTESSLQTHASLCVLTWLSLSVYIRNPAGGGGGRKMHEEKNHKLYVDPGWFPS